MQTIPTREEMDIYHSLDEIWTCEHFLGKTLEQAEGLFRENSCFYQEGLLWMGPVAFRFYIQAAIRYVRSTEAEGDSDIISALAAILEHRLEFTPPSELQAVAESLASFCGYVIENFDRFDAASKIYGDLRSRYVRLGRSIGALRTNSPPEQYDRAEAE